MSPPKIHVHPESQHVILYEIRVFADVITVRIEMKSYLTRGGPKSHGNFDKKGEQGDRSVKVEAETGVMLQQAKQCQELLATTRS